MINSYLKSKLYVSQVLPEHYRKTTISTSRLVNTYFRQNIVIINYWNDRAFVAVYLISHKESYIHIQIQ